MTAIRHTRLLVVLAGAVALIAAAAVPATARTIGGRDDLSADLDGKPIALVDVGKWYCHDFDYPRLHCFSDPKALEQSSSASSPMSLAAAGVTYVTVYEFTTYQGAYMHMNENYSALSLIGWNDRISSFVVKNSQSGAFWTDWLYGGTRYNFCCNTAMGSLGNYDNIFSSVFHN